MQTQPSLPSINPRSRDYPKPEAEIIPSQSPPTPTINHLHPILLIPNLVIKLPNRAQSSWLKECLNGGPQPRRAQLERLEWQEYRKRRIHRRSARRFVTFSLAKEWIRGTREHHSADACCMQQPARGGRDVIPRGGITRPPQSLTAHEGCRVEAVLGGSVL